VNTTTFVVSVGLFFFLLNCWAFIDIYLKDFGSLGRKVIWFAVAFIPFLGCVTYFLIGFWQGKKKSAMPAVVPPADPDQ